MKIVGGNAIKHKLVLHERNTYIVRVIVYVILLLVFYALLQQGVRFVIVFVLAVLFGMTNVALSLQPKATLSPNICLLSGIENLLIIFL